MQFDQEIPPVEFIFIDDGSGPKATIVVNKPMKELEVFVRTKGNVLNVNVSVSHSL